MSTSLPPEGSIEYDDLSQASSRMKTPSSNPTANAVQRTTRARTYSQVGSPSGVTVPSLEGGVNVYPSGFGCHFSKSRSRFCHRQSGMNGCLGGTSGGFHNRIYWPIPSKNPPTSAQRNNNEYNHFQFIHISISPRDDLSFVLQGRTHVANLKVIKST